MVIILPNEIDGLSDVQKKLQNTSLTNILSQGHEEKMILWLPKFKMESMLELNDVLKEVYIYIYIKCNSCTDNYFLYFNPYFM